jgi:hypothetical protein
MEFKKSFRKGFQIYSSHMEEETKDKVPSIKDHLVLKYYEDVCTEVSGFPPKIDIDFSNNLILGATPVSETPYRMGTPGLKES